MSESGQTLIRAPGTTAPVGNGPKPSPRLSAGWAAAIIVAVGILAYANSFSGRFFLDDYPSIVNNRHIHRLWPLERTLLGGGDMRPVVALSFAINYRLGGLNVWGYHAFNLAVHLLAALVLFGVVRRTLQTQRLRRHFESAATPVALAAALIWMVHPLQTQSVSYIVQRSESMMGLFFLLTLYCTIRGAGSSSRPWWYVAAAASCAVGMGCKQVMVMAPLVVLLYDRVFLVGRWRELLRRRWGLYLALCATWLILLAMGRLVPSQAKAGFQLAAITPLQYARTQFGVIMHYLRLAFWPGGLCLDYAWPIAQEAGEIVIPAIGGGLLLLATAMALWRRPAAGFLGAWFFLILAPTSSIMPIADPAFEHRMYLPLAAVVCLCLAGGWILARKLLPGRAAAAGGAGVVVLAVAALGGLTCLRNRDYADPVRMWSKIVDQRPRNPRARVNLGKVLYQRVTTGSGRPGDLATAKHHCEQALKLMPRFPEAHVNLGIVLAQTRATLPQAAECFRKALEIDPGNQLARFNLAMALDNQGRTAQAVAQLQQALERDPEWGQAHHNLGIYYSKLGDQAAAIPHFRQAVQLGPSNADWCMNLGLTLARAGEHVPAAEQFSTVMRLRPDYAPARQALLRIGRLREQFQREEKSYRSLLRDKPNDPQAMNSLARLLATCPDSRLRNGLEALSLAEKACRAGEEKDTAAYLDTLAAACAEVGQFEEAAATARRAFRAALASEQLDLAGQVKAHIKLYENGRPLRAKPSR